MRIIITGAIGMLGKNLLEILNYNETEVTLFVRNKERLSKFVEKNIFENVTVVKGDIRNFDDCRRNIKDIDTVIHLAAIVGSSSSVEEPRDTCITNSFGTLNVLEAMRLNDGENIIFPSSIAVYGNNINASESDMDKISPLTPYDFSKFLSEQLCEMYSSCYSIKHLIFRFSHLYGKYQSENNLISDLFKKIKTNNVVEIGNDVSRDFLNAKDAAGLITKFLNFKDSNVFNVGTGRETKISEVVQRISKIMNKKIRVSSNPSLRRDVKLERWRERANIKKIEGRGWKPSINLEKGLEELVRWYDARGY